MARFNDLLDDSSFAEDLSGTTTVDDVLGVFHNRGYNTDEDELRQIFAPEDDAAAAEWDYDRDHHGIGETIRRAFGRG